MFNQNKLFSGYISKPHGTGGRIVIRPDGDLTVRIIEGEPLFIEINETLVPFFIQEVEESGDKLVIKLEFIDTLDEVRRLSGSKVYLNPDKGKIQDKEISSFIGYTVKDVISGIIGIITGMKDTPMNPLFVVKCEEKELYIPFHQDLIISIDHTEKYINMQLPDGLADL